MEPAANLHQLRQVGEFCAHRLVARRFQPHILADTAHRWSGTTVVPSS